MIKIPKGELLEWGVCKVGEEDSQGRWVAEDNLIIQTESEYNSANAILRKALESVRKGLMAPCQQGYKIENSPNKGLVDIIDEALKIKEPDAGVCPVSEMTFGQAIEAMKQGKKVARKGWNGKGMWLCVPLCDGPKYIPATGIWGKPNAEYAEQNGGTVKVMPYITMKAADGSIVMGWLASQTDMLSNDWIIVE